MEREEALRAGASFYVQTAVWFMLTALLTYAARGRTDVVSDGGEAYAGLVALSAFALATLLVLLLAKTKAFMRVYSWLVYFAILYGAFYILALLWPIQAAFAMLPVAASLLFFSPRVLAQNLVLSVALAGVASQFGALVSFPVMMGLLAVLAIYDIVAVNITHHMVAMAKAVIEKHVPVVFVMPRELSGLSSHVSLFVPGSQAVFLGAGDIALPAVLIATAPNAALAFAVMTGSLLGFMMLTISFLASKRPHPLPALPFLMCGIVVALGIAVLR